MMISPRRERKSIETKRRLIHALTWLTTANVFTLQVHRLTSKMRRRMLLWQMSWRRDSGLSWRELKLFNARRASKMKRRNLQGSTTNENTKNQRRLLMLIGSLMTTLSLKSSIRSRCYLPQTLKNLTRSSKTLKIRLSTTWATLMITSIRNSTRTSSISTKQAKTKPRPVQYESKPSKSNKTKSGKSVINSSDFPSLWLHPPKYTQLSTQKNIITITSSILLATLPRDQLINKMMFLNCLIVSIVQTKPSPEKLDILLGEVQLKVLQV